MESLSVIAIQIASRASAAEARSALPDAPVVADAERPSLGTRARVALSVSLRRLADVVAPRRPVSVCPEN